MGCGQSKIENEETVTRCKERKQHMKDALSARNAFAAAHSAYSRALKNTGAALSDYAHGEVQYPPSSPSSSVKGGGPILPQPPVDPFPPPPPPLPFPPLQRAATMPEMAFPKPDLKRSDPIPEEENDDELEDESASHGLKHRSSKGEGSRSGLLRGEVVDDEELRKPPSPPQPAQTPPPTQSSRGPPPPPPPENKGLPSWDYFFPSMENVPGPTLAEVDEGRAEREEFERNFLEERSKRSEIDTVGGGGGGGGGSVGGTRGSGGGGIAEVVEKDAPEVPPPLPSQVAAPPLPPKAVKRGKQVVQAEGKRSRGSSSVNLLQICNEVDDCFLQASESAHEVSKMLEATRLHYHSNFADNSGNIDHSARVMRVITWNRSFRGLPKSDYDGKDDSDAEEHETHATVLDKMLAWEKKLYDEVKAGEQMKIEYQRKVASLIKLKKRDSNTEALERMKAAVSHLHTRYIVDMQSMDSTVSEINRLRDEQLYQKLVALVDAMATMWESMRDHHENLSKIAQALSSLHISQSPEEVSEHHHERTCQLYHVVTEWRSIFDKLINNQKDYIAALNKWLKLNLIPIDTNLKEKVSSPQRPASPPILGLLHAWHDHLEKLPYELARTAISNFAAVVNTIVQYQLEEMKLRDKCKNSRRELSKKTRQFEDWYNKYMQQRTPPDEMDPERAQDKDLIERQVQVEVVKERLKQEEDEYQKQCVQVREKSLMSLKNHLPEVFRAMSDFSLASSDMYRNLRSILQHRNNTESK